MSYQIKKNFANDGFDDVAKFDGEGDFDGLGYAVSAVGDFNNDGNLDILIDGPNDTTSEIEPGTAYLFFSPFGVSPISATNANVIINGDTPDDRFGRRVSGGL